MMMQLSAKQKSSLTLAALIFIFIGPMLAAWSLYSSHVSVFKSSHYGDLINPSLQFQRLALRDTNHNPIPDSQFAGKWLLVYFSPVSCDKLCAQNLYDMRQVRLALGKDQDRVERLLLTYAQSVNPVLQQNLTQSYRGTYQAIVTTDAIQGFFPETLLNTVISQQGGLFVVDPLGNVILHYSPNINPEMTYKDLTRLLRVSQIG